MAEPSGLVFNVVWFCVHDGPGIRTTVFLKGCPLACQWCHNPEGQASRPDLLYYEGRCQRCGACVAVCPHADAARQGGVIRPGDVLVLAGRGPLGSGMEEILQITGALKHLEFGKHVAVVTDARFSGVSTGACIGHVSPEGLAGGPIGKVLDGDLVEILIDRHRLEGSVNLVGADGTVFGPEEGTRVLAARPPRADLAPDPALPADTRLWAALAELSGGSWGGCVFDTEVILQVLEAGKKALRGAAREG